MRILIIDSLYPDFLKTCPVDPASDYETELQKILSKQFGTFDAYSKNLRKLGHRCIDVIVNNGPLQQMWAEENGRPFTFAGTAIDQIEAFAPDCVFVQDLSFFDAATLSMISGKYLLAGQLSCPWPVDDRVSKFHCLFSSFPHYINRISECGVKAVYLPLAFEPSVLEVRIEPSGGDDTARIQAAINSLAPERDIDISFVGGVGRESHWRQGTDTLEAVAAAFPDRFQWWGYGLDNLPAGSALRGCYKGEAWGREMYSIYRRSKIVISRHGEVSQGFTNNLRCYEATGCGALLMTENSPNLRELFPWAAGYSSPEDLCDAIHLDLEHGPPELAQLGQAYTLEHHTYAQRMKAVSETLKGMLCQA